MPSSPKFIEVVVRQADAVNPGQRQTVHRRRVRREEKGEGIVRFLGVIGQRAFEVGNRQVGVLRRGATRRSGWAKSLYCTIRDVDRAPEDDVAGDGEVDRVAGERDAVGEVAVTEREGVRRIAQPAAERRVPIQPELGGAGDSWSGRRDRPAGPCRQSPACAPGSRSHRAARSRRRRVRVERGDERGIVIARRHRRQERGDTRHSQRAARRKRDALDRAGGG